MVEAFDAGMDLRAERLDDTVLIDGCKRAVARHPGEASVVRIVRRYGNRKRRHASLGKIELIGIELNAGHADRRYGNRAGRRKVQILRAGGDRHGLGGDFKRGDKAVCIDGDLFRIAGNPGDVKIAGIFGQYDRFQLEGVIMDEAQVRLVKRYALYML